jgi:hypothetical protein
MPKFPVVEDSFFEVYCSDNFTTIMSASTQTKRGQSYANDLEYSSSVANMVSNVAAVFVDVAIRRR